MLFVLNAAGKEKRRSLNATGKDITFALNIGNRGNHKTSSGLKRTSRLPRGSSRCRRMSSLPVAPRKVYPQSPARLARAAQPPAI